MTPLTRPLSKRSRVPAALVATVFAMLLAACGTTDDSASDASTNGDANTESTAEGTEQGSDGEGATGSVAATDEGCTDEVTTSNEAVTLTDDFDRTVELDAPAERVVALEWQQIEDLLTLCIEPVAVADVEGYGTWVTSVDLPEGVEDVGTRGEPNIDVLVAADPDLIIVEVSGPDDPVVGTLEATGIPFLVTVGADTALELGLADWDAPVLGEFLIELDGVETTEVEGPDGRRASTVSGESIPVFSKLPITDQMLHTVSSPPVAYLLLLLGLSLIVFELYTAGVGVAGLVGAGALVLGAYGLATLPARWWAVALLVFTVLAYTVDVQTGVPRLWTAIGTVALVIGSLFLYDGLALSWITLLVGIVGMLIFVISVMPAMVRTRFATPTIGRGWMIGEEGEAVTAVDPDGVVMIRGARWRARTNRQTPIPAGEALRVAEVDGLLLEVEPLEGAARDHRERRRRDDAADHPS